MVIEPDEVTTMIPEIIDVEDDTGMDKTDKEIPSIPEQDEEKVVTTDLPMLTIPEDEEASTLVPDEIIADEEIIQTETTMTPTSVDEMVCIKA